jgi:hypothetical protein
LTEIDIQTTLFAQFLDLAHCFPPQPEGGAFPRRDFAEAVEDSTSAAPSASHVEKKKNVRKLSTPIESRIWKRLNPSDFSKEIEKAFPT